MMKIAYRVGLVENIDEQTGDVVHEEIWEEETILEPADYLMDPEPDWSDMDNPPF